jgi:colanic acid/amylovoran biosynthesis glycosyltransferase
MRVAMFMNSFPLVSETFILKQITGLMDLGHQVDIYAQMRPEASGPVHPEVIEYDLLARTTYMDMPLETGYWELPVWPVTGRTWPPGSATSIPNALRLLRALPKLARGLVLAPRLTLQVLRPAQYGDQARSLSALYRLVILAARRRHYDILHAQFGTLGDTFRFAKELWRAPLVVSFRGYDFSAWPRQHGADVFAKLFETLDAGTVNSEFTRGRVEKLGCPPHKLHRLSTGSRVEDFAFRERTLTGGEPVRILTVGRLVEKKGIEFSIRAIAKVRERHPEVQYDIVGDGPLRAELEQLAHELGVERAVSFHGARNREYVRELLDRSHLFVLSAVTAANGDMEGQGAVLQEAQAVGLPVVATDHDGFPESIVVGRSGFLVPERDVEGLAERVTHLIEHPESWPRMGREGRAHVERHFDISKLNRQLAELFEHVIAEARGQAAATPPAPDRSRHP